MSSFLKHVYSPVILWTLLQFTGIEELGYPTFRTGHQAEVYWEYPDQIVSWSVMPWYILSFIHSKNI